MEVDAAGESNEGILKYQKRKRVEEQESLSRLALYKNFEGGPAPEGLELEHRSGSTTLESMEQKRDLGTSIPTTSVSSSYPAEEQQKLGEAGYEMTYQTSTITWYKRISGNMEKAHGDGGRENNRSTSSGDMDTAGSDVQKPGTLVPGSGSSTGKNWDQSDPLVLY
ncbi:unnamed protein product [Calypogeia fissa]